MESSFSKFNTVMPPLLRIVKSRPVRVIPNEKCDRRDIIVAVFNVQTRLNHRLSESRTFRQYSVRFIREIEPNTFLCSLSNEVDKTEEVTGTG